MPSRLSLLQVCSLIFILCIATLAPGTAPVQALPENNEVRLVQFDMLTADSGWILLDQHVFWTSDAGQTWNQIGPLLPPDAVVQDVSFSDAHTGRVLWTSGTPEDGILYELAHTVDRGITWTIRSLSLFDPGEVASHLEKADMGWFDAQTGWISVKQTSGSNFSLGALFRTSDGGETWERFPLPVADQISFSDPQVGWAIGGPAGDQVFRSNDAGATWEDWKPTDLSSDTTATAYMPIYSGGMGLLAMTSTDPESALRIYALEDPSDRWLLRDRIALDSRPGAIAVSLLDPRNLVAVIPGTGSILRMKDGELELAANRDGLSASIVELDMVSAEVGWAKSVDSSCVRGSRVEEGTGPVSCSSRTRLLQTTDAGLTWQSMPLPLVQSDVISRNFSGVKSSSAVSVASDAGNTEVFIGQGFDKCEIPGLSQLQTWWNHSPYKTVNLYIGGSSRACANSALSLSYVQRIYRQGWKFIPTWVGPQAPCTGFRSRFSSDVAAAYQQGIDEANLAVERLAELGLTRPDKTGSVVYYDMEHYGTDSACRNAVNSFMSGWVSQLHARGNVAGVYASTLCDTGLSDYRSIANVPDVIWPARWYHAQGLGYYDPNASVWNLGNCVPNTAWANHQRIRQYEGGHNETWGNLTLQIDSNVLDGVVAVSDPFPFVSRIARTNANPTRAAVVEFNVTFSEPVTGVAVNDFALATTGISGASITAVAGSGSSYTVRVSTGSGNGTVRLDVPVTATITGSSGKPLGALPFILGEAYTVHKTPLAANPLSPGGNIGANSGPTYTWSRVSDATWYYLWVNGPNGNVIKQWYTSAQANCDGSTCSVTPSTALSTGLHTWWIQTWNDAGYGPWSNGMDFTVSIALPGKATLVSPTGGIGNHNPIYTWNEVSGATWYYLWVNGPSGNVIQQWYNSAQANCNGSTCSVTPPKILGAGSHTWWVQTWSSAGYGPWSDGMTFSTPPPPGRATLVSPAGSIAGNNPTYTWNQVNGATYYHLWVNGPAGNVIKQWYTAAQANCNNNTCSVTPSKSLGTGAHTWWIQTWSSAGYGPWSSGMNFSIP